MEPFDLKINPAGQWVLSRPGEADVVDVRVRRAFPLTEADTMVSLRSSESKELLFIDRVADLLPAQAAAIRQALESSRFVPTIGRVDRVQLVLGVQVWDVQTDRGAVQFRVQEREDIRFLSSGDFRLKDVDGNVYALPALDALDEGSRKAVEPLL